MATEEEIVSDESEGLQQPVTEGPSEDSVTAAREADGEQQSWSGGFNAWNFAPVIMSVLLAMILVKIASPTVMQPRIWTTEELSKYNGTDKGQPLLLSILGSVFDVTEGSRHYGPGGGYHHFTGRDASRAFVSGNFSGDGLTSSLQGLSPKQVKSIDDWRKVFLKKYRYVGTLVGPFYDEHGMSTKELARVGRLVARAEKAIEEQKKDEERFPSCNSRWSPQEGGEVWCTTGYPRIANKVSEGPYKGTPPPTRCACFEDKFLKKKDLRVYEGCAEFSQKCQSALPEVK